MVPSLGESEDEDDSLVSQGSRNAISTIYRWVVARRRAALSVSRPSSRVRFSKVFLLVNSRANVNFIINFRPSKLTMEASFSESRYLQNGKSDGTHYFRFAILLF